MKTEAVIPKPYPARSAQAFGATASDATGFAAMLQAKTAQAAAATASNGPATSEPADFTAMTRQELFDWMNGQIRAGKLSLDDSSAFLGMTIKVAVASGQPVPLAGDTSRIDFIEKARQGVVGALERKDPALAKRLETAIAFMLRNQGQAIQA